MSVEKQKECCIEILARYYAQAKRDPTPEFRNYSLIELKKCLRMFSLETEFFSELIKKKSA